MPDKEFETMEDFINQEDNPEPIVEPEGDPEPEPEGELEGEGAPKVAPKAEPKKDAPEKDKPNPMRELRDKANTAARAQEKIDEAINRMSDGEYDFKLKDFKGENGKIDYDKLIEAMDAADVKARAESKGLSPELQAEIEKYEREKKEVEVAKARVQMDRQLNNFQMEQQLNSDELNNFISDAMTLGINPLSIAALDKTSRGTTALQLLYKAVYIDKITKTAVDTALAEAETKRQASLDAQNSKPKSNPAAPNNSKTIEKNSKGVALEEFLKNL